MRALVGKEIINYMRATVKSHIEIYTKHVWGPVYHLEAPQRLASVTMGLEKEISETTLSAAQASASNEERPMLASDFSSCKGIHRRVARPRLRNALRKVRPPHP
jgi:hypothetical protein